MEEKNKLNKLEHPCFPQPIDTSIKVWRYMDLSKIIDLISRKSLFLCRLDLLSDPHEGSITKVSYENRQIELEKYGMSKIISTIKQSNKNINKSIFINCWYLDSHESEAMWKLYCPDNRGIAIQTTYKKLVDSINNDNHLYIGSVKYIDYETEWFPSGNLFYPIMHKRIAFQHEKEIRLVKTESKYWDNPTDEPPNGLYCPWNITTAIDNIYVNPYAENWYYEIVSDILNKYNCSTNLIWSTIKGIPYY